MGGMEERDLERGLLGAGEEPPQQIITREDGSNGSIDVSCLHSSPVLYTI